MKIPNEELNRRCAFFASQGLPYSDKVWSLLARAWDEGWNARIDHELLTANPYRGAPITDPAQAGIAYAKTTPDR